MKNKKVFLLLIIMLGIGFAAITTTLFINGAVNITTNVEDFDVRFTKAVLDNEDRTSTVISQDGKSMTFDTRDLSKVGDKSTLNFVVKNNSTMYDATIALDCNFETNEYYTVTRSIPSTVSARSQVTGSVQVSLIKHSLDDINSSITCSLNVNATERTTRVQPNTGEEVDQKAVVYDYATNGGTSATKATDSLTVGDIVDLSPSATKTGYTFVGWNTNSNAHEGLSTVSMDDDGVTLYAIFKKDPSTYKATFMLNGAGTQTNVEGSAVVGNVERTCTTGVAYNNETANLACNITTPTITGSVNTPEIVGYATSRDSTTADVAINTQVSMNENRVYYAITKNTGAQLVANFNANGSTLSSTSQKTCTILTTYNGEASGTTCTVDAPEITASSNTPTVIGYSLASDDHSNNDAYDASTGKITLSRTNTGNTWYAQTRNSDKTYTVNSFAKGKNVTAVSDTSSRSCEIDKTYNGVAQAESCSITPPEYSIKTGYTKVGWTTSSTSTTGATSVLTMTGNVNTYYAHASANSYTIEYYDGETLKGSSSARVDEDIVLSTKTALGLTKDGYTFKGWSTDGSQTITYTDGQTVNNLSTTEGDVIEIYAVWVDDVKPVCTFGTAASAFTGSTTTITLDCVDAGSKIVSTNLSASDFTLSNVNGEIQSVSAPTAITNGYSYTITLRALSVGTYTITLPANKISDNATNSNIEVVSNNIETRGITYTASFTAGDNVASLQSNALSCTTTGSNTTCSITLPDVNLQTGAISPEWYLGNQLVGVPGDSYELSGNVQLTAKATETTASIVTYTDTYNMGCTSAQCAIDKINGILS